MSTVITVENLGKKYILHHQQREQNTALRDVITNGVRNFSKKIFSPFTTHSSPISISEDFWALKDVSFEVKQGERVGIIGKNGAGKSTLLKILSRITEPTTGSVRMKGRVASLLEVGTGFHPELTGRENIYLNGAILGMVRVEIKRKFDEIVAFAEVERFLDTPVKHYSSGMYVRLAFAIAAHLEPEILIVDEVLAVGDAQFQKKCLGKIEEISEHGQTVLFVSHNLRTVLQLCNRAILFENGKVRTDASAERVVKEYLKVGTSGNIQDKIRTFIKTLPIDPIFELLNVRILQKGELIGTYVANGDPIIVEINFNIKQLIENMLIFVRLCEQDENLIFHSIYGSTGEALPLFEPGIYTSKVTIPADFLAPRPYVLHIGASIYRIRRCMPEWMRIQLDVVNTGCTDNACPGIDTGILLPKLEWITDKLC